MNEEIKKNEELNENELDNVNGGGAGDMWFVCPFCGHLYGTSLTICPHCNDTRVNKNQND